MKIGLLTRALLATTLATGGVPVRAEVVPGRWEKLEGQCRPDLPLIVTLQSGERLEVACRGTTEEELLVTTLGGTEMRLPKTEVLRVDVVVGDGIFDGLLKGVGAGFGAGALVAVGLCAGRQWCRSESVAAYAVGFGIVGAGIGGLTGLAIDSAQKKREVLYQAPQEAPPGDP
ncbi:MAG: hypothetical protein Kow00109_28000 [Acidobacteriota bacterium]